MQIRNICRFRVRVSVNVNDDDTDSDSPSAPANRREASANEWKRMCETEEARSEIAQSQSNINHRQMFQ